MRLGRLGFRRVSDGLAGDLVGLAVVWAIGVGLLFVTTTFVGGIFVGPLGCPDGCPDDPLIARIGRVILLEAAVTAGFVAFVLVCHRFRRFVVARLLLAVAGAVLVAWPVVVWSTSDPDQGGLALILAAATVVPGLALILASTATRRSADPGPSGHSDGSSTR